MKITQAFTFEAAHRLPNVPEIHRCHRMHGHSYRVESTIQGDLDRETGWVVDVFDVEKIFAPILERLDHRCLNEVEGSDPASHRGQPAGALLGEGVRDAAIPGGVRG